MLMSKDVAPKGLIIIFILITVDVMIIFLQAKDQFLLQVSRRRLFQYCGFSQVPQEGKSIN